MDKLRIDHARAVIDALRLRYGKDKTKLTDDQIAEGLEHYRPKRKVDVVVLDELRGGGTTDKIPAIHDKAADEIRFTCECGHVTHIVCPDPFELLSLYQDGMRATCEKCRRMSELELQEVVGTNDRTCEFCEPWHDPKPLVETPKLIIRLVVKDDMYRYVQLLRKGLFGRWRESELIAIDRCPICGKEV